MITLLADSNALRHPGLKAYLLASRNHAIALSDMTLVEMRKTNALSTSRESLEVVARFPSQVFALRRTDKMLEENVTSGEQSHLLFDYDQTVYLQALSRRLLILPPPESLREEMALHEADSRLLMSRLLEEAATLEPGMVSAAQNFTREELAQIRTMRDVTHGTRRKLLDLLKETTGGFILENQEPGCRAPMLLRDTMGLFAFRYSLCMLLYYMEWVRIGRQVGKKLALRVNDIVDMQLAAMGTFLNGVLSADEGLQTVSWRARAILRGYGAYVGEDWQAPVPPERRNDGSSGLGG